MYLLSLLFLFYCLHFMAKQQWIKHFSEGKGSQLYVNMLKMQNIFLDLSVSWHLD